MAEWVGGKKSKRSHSLCSWCTTLAGYKKHQVSFWFILTSFRGNVQGMQLPFGSCKIGCRPWAVSIILRCWYQQLLHWMLELWALSELNLGSAKEEGKKQKPSISGFISKRKINAFTDWTIAGVRVLYLRICIRERWMFSPSKRPPQCATVLQVFQFFVSVFVLYRKWVGKKLNHDFQHG